VLFDIIFIDKRVYYESGYVNKRAPRLSMHKYPCISMTQIAHKCYACNSSPCKGIRLQNTYIYFASPFGSFAGFQQFTLGSDCQLKCHQVYLHYNCLRGECRFNLQAFLSLSHQSGISSLRKLSDVSVGLIPGKCPPCSCFLYDVF